MAMTPDKREFWDIVEHELKVKQAMTWRMTMVLLRLGMTLVLFAASYILIFYVLQPSKGYFVWPAEMSVRPVFWALVGVICIIAGAYLRFRAIGPIVEHLKIHARD